MFTDGISRKFFWQQRRWLLPVLALVAGGVPIVAQSEARPALSADTRSPAHNIVTDWSVPPAFLAGMAAIAQGDAASVNAAIDVLGDNPLATYLHYRFLLDSPAVDSVDDSLSDSTENVLAVIAFLNIHPNYVFSKRLKQRSLRTLIQQKQFAAYQMLDAVAPSLKSSRRLTCQGAQAALVEGNLSAQQQQAVLKIWMQGRNQPGYCDPIFKWLKANNQLTASEYRQRIKASIIAGNPSFAEYLVRDGQSLQLKGLKAYFTRWHRAFNDPLAAVQHALAHDQGYSGDDEQALLIQSFKWLGRRDPLAAHTLLAKVPKAWRISANEHAQIMRVYALKAAYTRMPQAYDWLMALPEMAHDKETRTWAARAALRSENWAQLKNAIAAMPVDLAQEAQWQYWLARSDAELGHGIDAKARWQALVHTPNYYGLLAADRLGMAYPWPKIPPLPVIDTRSVEKNPTVQLAFYLHSAGLMNDARRAFMAALKKIPAEQIPALTLLADQSKWHDRVAIAIARMNKQFDPQWFAARFPTPWRAMVDAEAKANGIHSNWLYAVIRRESLFMSDVGSGAGAQGLMQLMPNTARWINRKAHLGLTALNLHDPNTSITLGAAYLAYLKDKFDGQVPLAVAAYNAGPGRVRQWLPEQRTLPGDVWVDTILFDETRNYVRAVLSASLIYSWREADKPDHAKDNLLSLLTPVQATHPTALSSIKPAALVVAVRGQGK